VGVTGPVPAEGFSVCVVGGVAQNALALVRRQQAFALQPKGQELRDRRQVPERQLLCLHGAQSLVPDGEEEQKLGQGVDDWPTLCACFEGAISSRKL
jgi:hypothetical protein